MALRAMESFATCYKKLFRIVANVSCENRVTSTNDTVARGHVDSVDPNTTSDASDGLKKSPHTGMKEICSSAAPHLIIGDMVKLGSWKISNQDVGTTRWLPADLFWDVSYGKIYGIGGLSTKKHELSFVTCNDKRNDGSSRLRVLQNAL